MTLQAAILITLTELSGDAAYGVTVRRRAEEVIGRPVNYGELYITLDRMEAEGLFGWYEMPRTIEKEGTDLPMRCLYLTGIGEEKARKVREEGSEG